MSDDACLLTDDQLRRFVTDGYLILSPTLPADVHRRVDERLLAILKREANPGNNILPMVPEMHAVLESPEVRGALASVLGPDYLLHPHRYVHNNEPGTLENGVARAGAGSHSFVGWHQDSHSPLARPRHHYCRYAMVLYYPQDTPVAMGPTQLIPATHLQRGFDDADQARGFQASGPAGTCVLVHFDIVHGGSLNVADRTRYMAKFVFARASEPAPSGRDAAWRTPEGHGAPRELPAVWSHHWRWLIGADPAEASPADAEIALDDLDADDEARRLTAIYTFGARGAAAVAPLAGRLAQCAENRWTEHAVVMEGAAYALAAIGAPAVDALIELLESPSEWVRVNAAFALGEIGARAAAAVPALTARLDDGSHAVVRTALDALGQIRVGARIALPAIGRLLTERKPAWSDPLYRRWTGQDQVRVNAMTALVRMGDEAAGAEEMVAAALDDPCGYVGGFGVEFLRRAGTPSAQARALEFLCRRRWDETLQAGVRTF